MRSHGHLSRAWAASRGLGRPCAWGSARPSAQVARWCARPHRIESPVGGGPTCIYHALEQHRGCSEGDALGGRLGRVASSSALAVDRTKPSLPWGEVPPASTTRLSSIEGARKAPLLGVGSAECLVGPRVPGSRVPVDPEPGPGPVRARTGSQVGQLHFLNYFTGRGSPGTDRSFKPP